VRVDHVIFPCSDDQERTHASSTSQDIELSMLKT